MLFVAMMEDEPSKLGERDKHRAAHLAYVESKLGTLQTAGPMHDPDTGDRLGATWMIEAPDAKAARAVVEDDPLYKLGVRKSVRLVQWKQVFKDGKKIG